MPGTYWRSVLCVAKLARPSVSHPSSKENQAFSTLRASKFANLNRSMASACCIHYYQCISRSKNQNLCKHNAHGESKSIRSSIIEHDMLQNWTVLLQQACQSAATVKMNIRDRTIKSPVREQFDCADGNSWK